MAKKILIVSGVIIGLIFIALFVARITGAWEYYRIPTITNEPNIKEGEIIFASNQKKILPYRFIVYSSKYEDSLNASYMQEVKPGTRYLQRLCGVPGDVIEMKNGVLFVNHRNFDEGLNLNIQYKITAAEFYLIEPDDINENANSGMSMISNDSAIVTFDNSLLKKYQSKINPVKYIITEPLANCFIWFDKNTTWTTDNFGPLKIPVDSYFVLGDNRHNALDSRYTGFVKKSDIKGVVLNK